jgi:predicted small secreted protein
MKRRILIAGLLLAAAFTLTACGESAQDKAKKDICSARSDIQKHVNSLQSLTLTTATLDQVKKDVTGISDDLKKIADASGKLNDQLRTQVSKANSEFSSQVNAIAGDLGTSLSISGAEAKLKSALQQLSAAYQQSFAQVKISC